MILKDIEGAMSPSEVSTALGLSSLKNRTWAIFKTSALKGEGLEQAMEWSAPQSLDIIMWKIRCLLLDYLLGSVYV